MGVQYSVYCPRHNVTYYRGTSKYEQQKAVRCDGYDCPNCVAEENERNRKLAEKEAVEKEEKEIKERLEKAASLKTLKNDPRFNLFEGNKRVEEAKRLHDKEAIFAKLNEVNSAKELFDTINHSYNVINCFTDLGKDCKTAGLYLKRHTTDLANQFIKNIKKRNALAKQIILNESTKYKVMAQKLNDLGDSFIRFVEELKNSIKNCRDTHDKIKQELTDQIAIFHYKKDSGLEHKLEELESLTAAKINLDNEKKKELEELIVQFFTKADEKIKEIEEFGNYIWNKFKELDACFEEHADNINVQKIKDKLVSSIEKEIRIKFDYKEKVVTKVTESPLLKTLTTGFSIFTGATVGAGLAGMVASIAGGPIGLAIFAGALLGAVVGGFIASLFKSEAFIVSERTVSDESVIAEDFEKELAELIKTVENGAFSEADSFQVSRTQITKDVKSYSKKGEVGAKVIRECRQKFEKFKSEGDAMNFHTYHEEANSLAKFMYDQLKRKKFQ